MRVAAEERAERAVARAAQAAEEAEEAKALAAEMVAKEHEVSSPFGTCVPPLAPTLTPTPTPGGR